MRGGEFAIAQNLYRMFGLDHARLAQHLGRDRFSRLAESANRSRLTILNSLRKMLVKPRFGMRRCNGIWPPSKPRIMREPLRERWPLWPRVEVFPMPEPMPRPTRFLFSAAFFGARMLDKIHK